MADHHHHCVLPGVPLGGLPVSSGLHGGNPRCQRPQRVPREARPSASGLWLFPVRNAAGNRLSPDCIPDATSIPVQRPRTAQWDKHHTAPIAWWTLLWSVHSWLLDVRKLERAAQEWKACWQTAGIDMDGKR